MSSLTVQIPKRAINSAYLPILNERSRFLIVYGGAGSGKSHFIAQRCLIKLLEKSLCNLLVVRSVGNTNRDSTFALFKQIISKWSLSKYFKVNESDLRIICTLNKNSIIFKGLDDSEKLKSVTFPKGELTDIWIEEASEVNESDFNQLNIRLRGGKSDKQIVISFNPIDVNHWLKKRFIDEYKDDVSVIKTTYKDNAFIDDDYKRQLEAYKDTDPYYYQVYCLGEWGVYGDTVFDSERVNTRIHTAPKPLKVGRFSYAVNVNKITDIKLTEDVSGFISIYEEPIKGVPYVIGGDTAGDGSDYFTAQVLDNRNGKQVAVIRHKFDEDVYAEAVYCLGMFYNTALIGVEVNFSTYPVKRLQQLEYPKLFIRPTEDNYTGRIQQSFGFKTTSVTRPLIIAELIKVVRDSAELISDIPTLYEMLTFVRNEKGRPEAQSGAHDDLIMALAIAFYIRPQQSFITESEKAPEPVYNFECERPKGDVIRGKYTVI